MATDVDLPKRQITPVPVPVLPVSVPQKRPLEDDHAPPVSSPLNPNPDVKPSKSQSHDDVAVMAREKPARNKKESTKKREPKAGAGVDSSRATPDPKIKELQLPPNESSPLRYKLAPPKPSDFETARGPVFTPRQDVVTAPDGSTIQFYETSEQSVAFPILHLLPFADFNLVFTTKRATTTYTALPTLPSLPPSTTDRQSPNLTAPTLASKMPPRICTWTNWVDT